MNELKNDLEAMILETEKFKKTLFRSNWIEISAGILVIIAFLIFAYKFRSLTIFLPIGSVLTVAGAVYIIIYILKNRMRKGNIPSKEDKLQYFKYWVGWYENTLKLGRNIFWWYLLPFAPGFIFVIIGFIKIKPDKIMLLFTIVVIPAIIMVGVVY